MSQCKEVMEVFSRVCGYYRPTSSWNKGKQEEYRMRKTFKLNDEVVEFWYREKVVEFIKELIKEKEL
jgi:ribonucleoside-triphosphate reductase